MTLQGYLSRLLESHGFDVISAGPLDRQYLGSLDMTSHDILLVDWREDADQIPADLLGRLGNWRTPVVLNDSTATRISLQQGNPELGRMLEQQIHARLARTAAAPDNPDCA